MSKVSRNLDFCFYRANVATISVKKLSKFVSNFDFWRFGSKLVEILLEFCLKRQKRSTFRRFKVKNCSNFAFFNVKSLSKFGFLLFQGTCSKNICINSRKIGKRVDFWRFGSKLVEIVLEFCLKRQICSTLRCFKVYILLMRSKLIKKIWIIHDRKIQENTKSKAMGEGINLMSAPV